MLLVAWLAIGTGLRLTRLATKPPWTDEFSTIVFSLGNSFLSVPLDRAIALDVLLEPLQLRSDLGIANVVQHLLSESNHPPLYFVLAHCWMQLWPPDSVGLASVWAARALPAILGAASIPAIYTLSWFAFRSRLVGQVSAAIMAVSPYGIFLAQEARHYTMAILWVIASLSCLASAIRYIQARKPLPPGVALIWVVINAMGVSTHYLFALTLCAEAMVLMFWILPGNAKFWRIYAVALGTLVACLVWLPVFLQNNHGSELTDWIRSGDRVGLAWLNPVFQAFAAWLTMLYLLPVEAPALPVVLISGLVMLVFFIWALPILMRGFKTQLQQPASRLMTQLFAGVACSAIALFFFFAYAFGIDLTRGARYSFVYFPSVMILLGASLTACWNSTEKRAVVFIWLMGLLSGLTVVCNLGYQKYYRPDLLVQLIQQSSPQSPVLIATTHRTHVQTGEMMGIARELKVSGSPLTPQFLLAHQNQPNTSTRALEQTLSQLPRPLDLWLVNFHGPAQVTDCVAVPLSSPSVNGYQYRLYHCPT